MQEQTIRQQFEAHCAANGHDFRATIVHVYHCKRRKKEISVVSISCMRCGSNYGGCDVEKIEEPPMPE